MDQWAKESRQSEELSRAGEGEKIEKYSTNEEREANGDEKVEECKEVQVCEAEVNEIKDEIGNEESAGSIQDICNETEPQARDEPEEVYSMIPFKDLNSKNSKPTHLEKSPLKKSLSQKEPEL